MIKEITLMITFLLLLGATLENKYGVSYPTAVELQDMIRACEKPLRRTETCRLQAVPTK